MKKSVISILCLFSLCLFVECCSTCENNTNQQTIITNTKSEKYSVCGVDYDIIIIDSCEYFFHFGSLLSLTHKGNCKNPIHKHQ